jgi:hypothetical protein
MRPPGHACHDAGNINFTKEYLSCHHTYRQTIKQAYTFMSNFTMIFMSMPSHRQARHRSIWIDKVIVKCFSMPSHRQAIKQTNTIMNVCTDNELHNEVLAHALAGE